MRGARCNYVQVVRFVRRLRGASQPVLVEGIDGNLYVLKFGNNPLGPNVPFNEAAGHELFRQCRLAVPRWQQLYISKSFLDRNRACWLESANEVIRPESGMCFGARFVEQGGVRLYELLPAGYHSRIQNRQSFWLAWIIDFCCGSPVHREAIFVRGSKGQLEAVFIDSGDLFGGSEGTAEAGPWVSTYLDKRIYPEIEDDELKSLLRGLQSLNMEALNARVRTLPIEWKTPSALARYEKALALLQNPLRLGALVEQLFQNEDLRRGNVPMGREGNKAGRPLYLLP